MAKDIAREYRNIRVRVNSQIERIKKLSKQLSEAQLELEKLNNQREDITTEFMCQVATQHI